MRTHTCSGFVCHDATNVAPLGGDPAPDGERKDKYQKAGCGSSSRREFCALCYESSGCPTVRHLVERIRLGWWALTDDEQCCID